LLSSYGARDVGVILNVLPSHIALAFLSYYAIILVIPSHSSLVILSEAKNLNRDAELRSA